MSAYICSDTHIATIAVSYAKLVGTPDAAQAIADRLLAANIRSVSYRYDEDTPIRACELAAAEVRPLRDLPGLVRCWDYQACERPDWGDDPANFLGQAIAAQFNAVLAALGERANADIWSI